MKEHWFIWIPRVLMILFGAFMLLMSFDSFDGNASIWQKLLGFLIHNLPLIVLMLIVWQTWHRPFLAGVFLLVLSATFTYFFRNRDNVLALLVVGGTPVLAGILFIVAHYLRGTKTIP